MRADIVAVVSLVTLTGCAAHKVADIAAPADVDLAELWKEPRNLASRDLFHGAGGRRLAPDPSARFELVKVDDSGFSPGYQVRDPRGVLWNVKLGIEAQSEVVASRVLWALGYHQPPTYLVEKWTLTGEKGGPQPFARFRRESPDQTVVSDWSWYENPFSGTAAFKRLLVANLILNNWDLKTSNNKIYDIRDRDGSRRRVYVVRDLGASLGKTTFPTFLAWTPLKGMPQGSRNDLEDFEEQSFIRGVDGAQVKFDYRGTNLRLVKTVTVDDVVQACRSMARISETQWRDAFRAGGYSETEQQRYISKMKEKIQEGLALAGS